MTRLSLRLGLALIFFLALDSLAFRTGYTSILEPDSTAGYLQQFVWNEVHRPLRGPYQVLAVGDSRVGLKTRVANLLAPETGYTLATIAVPASQAMPRSRSWDNSISAARAARAVSSGQGGRVCECNRAPRRRWPP